MNDESKLAIYQVADGAIKLPIDAKLEMIWASQAQIVEIFDVTPQNITIYLAASTKKARWMKRQLVKNPYKFKKKALVRLSVPSSYTILMPSLRSTTVLARVEERLSQMGNQNPPRLHLRRLRD